MYILVSCFILFTIMSCHAQSVNTRIGAPHAGIGYASFTLHDEAALFNNVGAMARLESPTLFFSYEVATELPGANRTAAAISWPTSLGTLAIGAFRFGDEFYNEQFLSAGFSNRLGATSLGAKINFVQYRTNAVETITAFTVDFGGLTQLTPELQVGAGIFNLTQSSLVEGEVLPVILVAAIGYEPDQRLLLAAELEKQLGSPLRIKGGVTYVIAKKIFFRSGFNLNPVMLFGGLGAKTRRTNIDYTISYNSSLGFAHQASAGYRLKTNSEK